MARRGTFDSKRAEARRLFDQGLSCRAIAKELGCSPSTVSRWAEAEKLSFDRSQTAAAVQAHTVDLAKARVELAQEMAAAGLELLRARHRPYLVFNFGGKDNTYEEHTLDRPPVEVIRNAVTTAGIAFDKASRVVESTPEGQVEAESVLDRLEALLEAESDEDDA